MVDPIKRRGLGRGLDALLPAAAPAAHAHVRGPESFYAPIEDLHPNRRQPRTHFDDKTLDELAVSLRERGLLQPILVRKRGAGGYEIVAGERRWRAAQRAGLHEVAVVVHDLGDAQAFEAALIENLQREDLSPIETARGYQRLIDEGGHSVESVSQLIGKDRSTVANAVRLLKLPESVIDHIANGELSEGHGRALLGAADVAAMERLAAEAVSKGWSVRETERRARVEGDKKRGPKAAKSANTRDLEERLSRRLVTRVTLADRKGKGHINVAFSSYDELDRLLEQLLPPE
ncbi:MAG: ParB/RepB/Spo0J family partition protein [Polyangiales bacterium]